MKNARLESLESIIFRLLVDNQVRFSLLVAFIMVIASAVSGRSFIASQEHANRHLSMRVGDYFDSASRVIGALAAMPPDQTSMDAVREAYDIFDEIYLIDPAGRLLMTSPVSSQFPIGMDMSNQPYFSPEAAGLIVSKPFTSPRTGNLTVTLSLPTTARAGLIVGELNLAGLQDLVLNTYPSNREISYISTPSGDLLAHPDYDRVQYKESIRGLGIIERAQQGYSSQTYFINGEWVVGVTAEEAQTGWLVITQTPLVIVYSYYLLPAILGLGLAFLLLILIVWNEKKELARQVVHPLSSVSHAAERLALGDYTTQPLTELDAPIREIASLAGSFERMKQAVITREAALIESEERWQFALEGPGDGVWDMMIADGRVNYSRQYKAMLGYDEDEFGDRLEDWSRRLHPDDVARTLQAQQDHLNHITPIYISEFRMQRKDGSYIWILSRGKVIQWAAGGQPLRMLGTHVDITPIKQIQKELDDAILQLEQKNQQLEELNASKDKLFSIIAHDLRGPLASFIAFGQLFETIDDMDRDSYLTLLDEYNQSARRIMDLLDNLLTWARSQRGHIITCPETFFLSRTAQRNIELIGQYANQKKVTLKNMISPNLAVYADSYMIDRVVHNLLSNAVKFSHPGGCVEIWAEPVGDQVEVSIRDAGIGIPAAILDQIFQVGTTSKQAGTAGEQGTGLGLIVCKEFVEKNGGVIEIESRPDQGSTFRFTLPRPR